jgi:rhodanese-related sulfurtransferase
MKRVIFCMTLPLILLSVPLFAQDTTFSWPDVPASVIIENGHRLAVGEHSITAEDLAHRMLESPDSVLVVDLRTDDEREIGTIPGNRSIKMDEIFTDAAIESLPRDRTIVLYCSMGSRSAIAWLALRSLGFDVYSLEDGFRGWKRYLIAEPETGAKLVRQYGQ